MLLCRVAVSPAMLVLLLALCFGLAEARYCDFVTETLIKTHKAISEPLGLKDSAVGLAPVFDPLIKTINRSFQRIEQMVLMNSTLDVYLRILDKVLQNSSSGLSPLLNQVPPLARVQVQRTLTSLHLLVQQLKRTLYQEQQQDIKMSVLNSLEKIEVDDLLVQKKALAEFKQVYQAASVIGFNHCGPTTA